MDKYKETLERAKEQLKKAKVFDYKEGQIAHDIRETVYAIFPELKESEDERIRKALIKAVSGTFKGNKLFGTDVTREEALAWLEKQGEQKSLTIDIKSMVDSYEQRLIKNGGVSNSPLVNMCVEAFQHGVENTLDELHLKQILANSCETCKDEQKPTEWHREDERNLNACLGYIPVEFLRRWLKDVIHEKYDKPAWSEEDEKEYKYVLKLVDNILNNCGNKKDYERYKRCYDWLKSFKERIEKQ